MAVARKASSAKPKAPQGKATSAPKASAVQGAFQTPQATTGSGAVKQGSKPKAKYARQPGWPKAGAKGGGSATRKAS